MKILLYPLILLQFAQCGPNQAEQAEMQKAREDSIVLATQRSTQLRMEKKLTITNQIQNLEAELDGKSLRLSVLKADLVVQRDKLNRVKQPQFLRTPQDRESQIRSAVLAIEQTEKSIATLESEVMSASEKLTSLKQELKQYE